MELSYNEASQQNNLILSHIAAVLYTHQEHYIVWSFSIVFL